MTVSRLTVAILLSVIGLAGLAGYTVAQRSREIGLRIALGARASHVVRAILARMSRPIVIGFVCGAVGGSAVATVLRSGIPTMSGLNVFDPLPYVMAMAFFAAVVALSVGEERRFAPGAQRVDPLLCFARGARVFGVPVDAVGTALICDARILRARTAVARALRFNKQLSRESHPF